MAISETLTVEFYQTQKPCCDATLKLENRAAITKYNTGLIKSIRNKRF